MSQLDRAPINLISLSSNTCIVFCWHGH